MNLHDELKSQLEKARDRFERTKLRQVFRARRRAAIMMQGCPVMTGERLRKTLLCCPQKTYPCRA